MLAYVFWHRPRQDTADEREAYERATIALHRSLARARPAGMCGSAVFRVTELPWLAPGSGATQVEADGGAAQAGARGGAAQTEASGGAAQTGAEGAAAQTEASGGAAQAGAEGAAAQAEAGGGGGGYEDWYLVEDYTALGVLNEAAVSHGHRTVHDDVARRFGAGAGGLYGLVEGELAPGLESIGAASLAVWVARTPGAARRGLGELLGDGMDPESASLWRRQLVLGPAPEFCLLAPEAPAGAAPTRLPEGWTARTLAREALWHG